MQVVTAKRASSQTQLHDVEELAVAGINLEFAVVQHIIGGADAGSDLIAPAEVDRREPFGIISRVGFMIKADPQVQRQSGIPDSPSVL